MFDYNKWRKPTRLFRLNCVALVYGIVGVMFGLFASVFCSYTEVCMSVGLVAGILAGYYLEW